MTITTEHVDALTLSCQGLSLVDDTDGPTFHGQPVDGYAEEIARRGEGHVYGCELIGHMAADHYHVFAVQDWGGSQEWIRAWDDRWSRAEAEQWAKDMAEADAAYTGYHNAGMDIDLDATRRKFSDERFSELISTNVCPGWDGIWVIPCDEECAFQQTFAKPVNEWPGKPYWTPKADEN